MTKKVHGGRPVPSRWQPSTPEQTFRYLHTILRASPHETGVNSATRTLRRGVDGLSLRGATYPSRRSDDRKQSGGITQHVPSPVASRSGITSIGGQNANKVETRALPPCGRCGRRLISRNACGSACGRAAARAGAWAAAVDAQWAGLSFRTVFGAGRA